MRTVSNAVVLSGERIWGAYACTTCGTVMYTEDHPCGYCSASPERRDDLRWALETAVTLGPADARIERARQRRLKDEEGMGEEGEGRSEALRVLADRDEMIALLRRLILDWHSTPPSPFALDVIVGPPSNNDLSLVMVATPTLHSTASIAIPLPSVPLFALLLLDIMDGPAIAVTGFQAAYARIGEPRSITFYLSPSPWPWHLELDGIDVRNPLHAARSAAVIATKYRAVPVRECSGCRSEVGEGVEWCKDCLALIWAGELTNYFGHPRKAIAAVVERRSVPNTKLPEPNPIAVVSTIDRMTFDNQWLRIQTCRILAARGWCGARIGDPIENGLVMVNGDDFAVKVMLDLERHERPGIVGFSKKQITRLLPNIVAIPWFLPDVREQVSSLLEEATEVGH